MMVTIKAISKNVLSALFLLGFSAIFVSGAVLQKRQTFQYPDELRQHAQRFQPWTRMLHGTVARYAPSEWPAWFTRQMMIWDIHPRPRYAPYHPNDVRYVRYRLDQIKEAPTALKEAPVGAFSSRQ